MSLGNFVALRQTSVKRMLAYSSIAQAGYILLGLAAINPSAPFTGINGLLIYIFAYLFTNIGAFLVVMAVEKQTGSNDFSAFAGLIKRSPVLALLMSLFMLSLAGIPPTAGFFGKFYVFAAVVETSMWGLAAVAAVNVVIGAGYYLNLVRVMFFRESESDEPVSLSSGLRVSLIITAVMVLLVGLAAEPFIQWVNQSVALVVAGGGVIDNG